MCNGICLKCKSVKIIVFGAILIINYFVLKMDLGLAIGSLMVLAGVVHILKPDCGHAAEKPVSNGKSAKPARKK